MITATLDPSMLPDGLQGKIEEVAQKIDPRHRSVDFNRVLNSDEDGHRRFGFYVKVGAPWNCMACGHTHDVNNFALQWSERTKTVSLFCIRAAQKRDAHPVAELERWAPRQQTHYDVLGVDTAAVADDIIAAAAMPPANVTPQQVQAAVRVLSSPGRRQAYDQQTQGADPDGSDSDDEDVTDGALTLADVKAENPALHDFVVAVYGQYLPSTEPEQVVGTVRLVSVSEEDDSLESRQFSIKLCTAGTDYVCPFAGKKHSKDGAALVYLCKDDEGCCKLTLVCDRQHRCMSHDKCVSPAAARSNLAFFSPPVAVSPPRRKSPVSVNQQPTDQQAQHARRHQHRRTAHHAPCPPRTQARWHRSHSWRAGDPHDHVRYHYALLSAQPVALLCVSRSRQLVPVAASAAAKAWRCAAFCLAAKSPGSARTALCRGAFPLQTAGTTTALLCVCA